MVAAVAAAAGRTTEGIESFVSTQLARQALDCTDRVLLLYSKGAGSAAKRVGRIKASRQATKAAAGAVQ